MDKVTYLDNGHVMEISVVALARWYMDCYRKENFSKKAPGAHAVAGFIDYELPLSEYDDIEGFLEGLAQKCSDKKVRKSLMDEIRSFTEE